MSEGCPKCDSTEKLWMQRSMHGKSKCKICGYEGLHTDWIKKDVPESINSIIQMPKHIEDRRNENRKEWDNYPFASNHILLGDASESGFNAHCRTEGFARTRANGMPRGNVCLIGEIVNVEERAQAVANFVLT